jgi:hypothetical protein
MTRRARSTNWSSHLLDTRAAPKRIEQVLVDNENNLSVLPTGNHTISESLSFG